jgi:hypothetical protein
MLDGGSLFTYMYGQCTTNIKIRLDLTFYMTHFLNTVHSTVTCIITVIMLLSHSGEYGCEWAYECNSPPFRNDQKVFDRHSYVFVSIRSWGVANIRNMLLKFARKALFSQHIRKQSQAFASIRKIRKHSQDLQGHS